MQVISAHPEKLFVNRELHEDGLRRTRLVYLDCRTFAELFPEYDTLTAAEPNATTPASL